MVIQITGKAALMRELEESLKAIERARELHVENAVLIDMLGHVAKVFDVPLTEIGSSPRCTECGHTYPCPTIRALDGAE